MTSDIAIQALTKAGWSAGRTCDITGAEQALAAAGFRPHEEARRFLREHYSLAVDVPIAGFAGWNGRVHFSPELATRFITRQDLPRLRELMPESACPIGTTGGQTVFVFLDAEGQSYLLELTWSLFGALASSPAETVRALCDGRNGRVDAELLDDQGRPTGRFIRGSDDRSLWHRLLRQNDERSFWAMERYSKMAPFLPRVAMSPLRHPPTWRALVNSAEEGLQGGANPRSLVVSDGGYMSRRGKTYFVAHGEDCLYVRAQAGFRVVPGISKKLEVGEVLELVPPAPL